MNRKVMVGLFAGVVALAISNVILGIVATDIYRTYNELRRDPLGLLQARETPAGEYDFLLIGDSLAEQWKIPGYAVVNKGISAQTTGQVRYRMQLFEEGIHAEKSIICVGGERSQNPAR